MIAKFFKPKSLDSILGTFNKVHNDLDNFTIREQVNHDNLRSYADNLHKVADGKAAEIEAANRVKGKIADLLS